MLLLSPARLISFSLFSLSWTPAVQIWDIGNTSRLPWHDCGSPLVWAWEWGNYRERSWTLADSIPLPQWFPTCGTRTPGGTRGTGWGYAKIILAMAENTKKGVKIKTQKQSYEVLVYTERLMWKLSLDPPTTSHIIILMLLLFVWIFCYAAIMKKFK
jgi:hypothetical protein